MAAFDSLRPLFEKPLPENPTLMESLSWNQIKAVKPPDDAAVTEIFGELHFEERRPPADTDPSDASFSPADSPPAPHLAPSTSPWSLALDRRPALDGKKENLRRNGEDPSMDSSPGSSRGSSDCFPSFDSLLGVPRNEGSPRGKGVYSPKGHAESLQFCTEGLGFESSDDVEDSWAESGSECCQRMKETAAMGGVPGQLPSEGFNGCSITCSERPPRARVEFPPPISCIGSRGKPWVRFRSYRQDGRFVLREVRLPNQELLHAFRKDGRLKLHFVRPDEDIEEEEEEEEEAEAEEEEDNDDGQEAEGGEEEGEEAEGGEQGAEEAEEEGGVAKKEEFGGVD